MKKFLKRYWFVAVAMMLNIACMIKYGIADNWMAFTWCACATLLLICPSLIVYVYDDVLERNEKIITMYKHRMVMLDDDNEALQTLNHNLAEENARLKKKMASKKMNAN